MKIIEKSITKQEAFRLCTKIYHIAQSRPRIRELLNLDCDPKHSPLAQQFAQQLAYGKLVVINRSNGEIFTSRKEQVDKVPDLALTPAADPEIKIHLVVGVSEEAIGPIPLNEFEKLLPTIDLNNSFLWHKGIETFVNLAGLKRRLIG
jgi:hypothetical protein